MERLSAFQALNHEYLNFSQELQFKKLTKTVKYSKTKTKLYVNKMNVEMLSYLLSMATNENMHKSRSKSLGPLSAFREDK